MFGQGQVGLSATLLATAMGAPQSNPLAGFGSSLFGAPSLGSGQVNALDDVEFQSAGMFGGLFDDPIILMAIAGVAFLFFTQGK